MSENILNNLFCPELMLFQVEAETWQDVLESASDYLMEKGYVKESFKTAIIQRELHYPTGLATVGVKVALPHTDTVHVLKSGILFMNLKQPVLFKEMGNGKNDVPVELVFVITVAHVEDEVEVLQKMMKMLVNEAVLKRLKNCQDQKKMSENLTAIISAL